jgi:hypothetical protein
VDAFHTTSVSYAMVLWLIPTRSRKCLPLAWCPPPGAAAEDLRHVGLSRRTHGELVTKQALFKAVWPGTAVTDGVLTTGMGELRKALGETAKRPQYIATIHRRGYRFIAPVTAIDQPEPSVPPLEPLDALDSPAAQPPHVFAQPRPVLVDREAELSQLHQHFMAVCQGQRQVVFATGEAGIGKTTLVEAFVLVLEDLHWSDVSTLDWLGYIARRRQLAHLFVLGTYRPVDAMVRNHPVRALTQELRHLGQCTEVPLAYLSKAGVAAYLAGRFKQAALPERLGQSLHQRTNGNPLFLVTMVDGLVQQGMLREGAVEWELTGDLTAVEMSVPEGLRQLIVQHLERLVPVEQEVLEAASVAGAEFTVAAVAACLQRTVEDIEAHCATFARRGQFLQACGADGRDHTNILRTTRSRLWPTCTRDRQRTGGALCAWARCAAGGAVSPACGRASAATERLSGNSHAPESWAGATPAVARDTGTRSAGTHAPGGLRVGEHGDEGPSCSRSRARLSTGL